MINDITFYRDGFIVGEFRGFLAISEGYASTTYNIMEEPNEVEATNKRFPEANTSQAIFDLGVDGLKSYIKPHQICHGQKRRSGRTETAESGPVEFKIDVHHWLILHGRYTCLPRKPRCGSSLIEDLCEYKDKVDKQK